MRRSRASYIGDLVESGRSDEDAAAIADSQLQSSFPDGRAPTGQRVYAVIEESRPIGYVWFGAEAAPSDQGWWLWDIEVDEPHRGHGLGTEVMALIEAEIRRLGGKALGLSVSGENVSARRLYERLGYETVAVRMRKVL